MTADLPASLRSTSMPIEQVAEPMRASEASLEAQLLELFFDRVPMGIAVFGTDLRLQRCNKTWTGFYEHYFGVADDYTKPGRHIFDLIPGNDEAVSQLFENALAGRVVRQAAHPIGIPGQITYWDVVFAPLWSGGEVIGAVDIVTDATDRVLALQRLEARIAAFTAIAAGMTVDQPLEVMLREVLARVLQTTAAVGCWIVSWTDDTVPAPEAYVAPGVPPGFGEALISTPAGNRAEATADADSDGPRVEVHRGFRRQALNDPRFAPMRQYWDRDGWEDLIVVPLSATGRAFGELHVVLPGSSLLAEDDKAYLVAVADQAAVALQNAALFAAAAQSATLMERQRLARDLHDSVSQALFSMTLHAGAAERHLAAAGFGADSPAAEQVAQLRELTAGALAEMRALIFELRPGALAEEGLAVAVAQQAAALSARTGVEITVRTPADRVALPAHAEEQLYRLALEALNNALKHADATRLSATLSVTPGQLLLVVEDDGVGFDPGLAHPGHLGLHTMRERAAAVGGRLQIDSAPRGGTRVEVTVPLG